MTRSLKAACDCGSGPEHIKAQHFYTESPEGPEAVWWEYILDKAPSQQQFDAFVKWAATSPMQIELNYWTARGFQVLWSQNYRSGP